MISERELYYCYGFSAIILGEREFHLIEAEVVSVCERGGGSGIANSAE